MGQVAAWRGFLGLALEDKRGQVRAPLEGFCHSRDGGVMDGGVTARLLPRVTN